MIVKTNIQHEIIAQLNAAFPLGDESTRPTARDFQDRTFGEFGAELLLAAKNGISRKVLDQNQEAFLILTSSEYRWVVSQIFDFIAQEGIALADSPGVRAFLRYPLNASTDVLAGFSSTQLKAVVQATRQALIELQHMPFETDDLDDLCPKHELG